MSFKEQTIYEQKTGQFKYLSRGKNIILHRVDINELNKRLNRTKRSSFYTTILISMICFSSLAILVIISIKF
jgi:hypothetical protein